MFGENTSSVVDHGAFFERVTAKAVYEKRSSFYYGGNNTAGDVQTVNVITHR